MKTKKDLQKKILEITMKIRTEYPELAMHLDETPVDMPENDADHVKMKSLEAYYDSLVVLLDRYSKTHEASK